MTDTKADEKADPKTTAGSDPVLSDEDFATLDADGDGVVHLCEETMKGTYPIVPLGKSLGGAPENKDRAAKPTQLPADEPENVTPRNGRRGR